MSTENRPTLRPIVRPDAEADLLHYVLYIGEHSEDAAARLTPAFYATVESLCKFPGLGRRLEHGQAMIWDIRRFAIRGFPNHIILYSVVGEELVVARIVHSAQDLERLAGQSLR